MSEKIWLKEYPPGVPAEINPNVYSSLVELFEESCRIYPDNPMATNMGTVLSFSEMEKMSRDFAAFLQTHYQLKKGDRVAIMLPNLLQYYVSLFGILRAGLVVVNVNPLYTVRELVEELADSKAETIIILANFANTLQKALPKTEIKNIIVTEIGDMYGFLKSKLVNYTVRYIKRLIPSFHFDHFTSFNDALKQGHGLAFERIDLSHQDMAFLQYTGGTTGISKGAILTHGNLVANVEQALAWIAMDDLIKKGQEQIIVPLPLYHIFCMTVCALCFVKLGGTAHLITNPRDMKGFIKQLTKIDFTVFVGVNTLFNGMLHHPDFKKINFKHLKLTVAGGAPTLEIVSKQWKEATGKLIIEGYGLTEASPIVTITPTNATEYRNTIGLPIPSTDVVIRKNGTDLPPGEEGELCVKGPQVMAGYWRKEQETAEAFTPDGWLRTGDIATYDNKGYFRIVDRKKDMILVSGFNVYPNEIEGVLSKMPGILEVAVIGIPSDQTGEAVKAYVVKKNPNLTKKDIQDYSHKELTGYKVPKEVEFVHSLPKSNVGKILRRELRQESAEERNNASIPGEKV